MMIPSQKFLVEFMYSYIISQLIFDAIGSCTSVCVGEGNLVGVVRGDVGGGVCTCVIVAE